MNQLRKIWRLTWAEQALLVRAGLLILAIRVGLWVLPWHSLLRGLRKLGGVGRLKGLSADRMAWAVRHASRLVPRATCLTQALALHHLLVCAGHPSRVHLGVAKDAQAGFQAHAWVEYAGRPLLSGPSEVVRYVPLHAIENRLS